MLLKIENLSKSFIEPEGRWIPVLQKISFNLKHNQRIAVVGPSGSGKSTFLHLLAGIEKPDSGNIYFMGEKLSFEDKNKLAYFRREKIGFIFQFYHLLSELNVIENIMLPLLFNKHSYQMAKKEALNLLEKFALKEKANSKVESLSGGEMQRIAILRAIIHKPRLLLADEPTGNLDPKTQKTVLNFLLKLSKESQTAIICVTHSNEIASMFDKVYLLKNGKLIPQ